MPKLADHEQRRAQITDALLRIVAATGLHSVTMRAVAQEAGVSLRLVQYYFQTKERLLLAAVEHVGTRLADRLATRVRGLGEDPGHREVIETIVGEVFPTDADSRMLHIVYTSYAVLAMTSPELAGERFLGDPDALERYVAGRFQAAADAGELADGTDPRAEAAALMGMYGGLGTSVVLGQRTAADALAVIGHHLDRVFRPRRT
ncbi:TetR/AcrR family transcriptional regulator [Phytomonospora sp. NPDC050363]|uniref:TetR/AcrR family transcriptional regulator n=1 Tax=Phytomonospora sp. NPDC050363 TaxID=3155642 RepID=UPI0033EC1ACF